MTELHSNTYDVIIIGAGAAGLFCAAQAGARGKRVLLLDHANRVGKKILMSGGGRCNFTNMYTTPEDFQSDNPHYVKSALAQYTQWDFIALVESHNIPYHEKTQGQLFCDNKSSDIVQMLVLEAQKQAVEIRTHCTVSAIDMSNDLFRLYTSLGSFECSALVIATGGLSIPTMGATPFGYEIGQQVGHTIVPTRAGLVPFIWDERRKKYKSLSGVSCPIAIRCGNAGYTDDLLFTHRGLSGPAILKISSHWSYGEPIEINFLPANDVGSLIEEARKHKPNRTLARLLKPLLPRQVIEWLMTQVDESIGKTEVANLSRDKIKELSNLIHHWRWIPADTEGNRTAEVTLGGIDTNELSSKTMMSKKQENLYFIGEVVDVTGQLGGFNFQWAWSSAYAAAQAV